jgi:FtsP/CotA-like multicopper oxidase with cupredoxin domain
MMRKFRVAFVALLCLSSALVAFAAVPTPARASHDVLFHLYAGRNTGAIGWGFTNTSLTTPGPLIQVSVGDNVTLNLTSVDGRTHTWYIDYNNNSHADATEPRSPNFGIAQLWNFTVSNVTGTYRYRSSAGGDTALWGNITISAASTGSGGPQLTSNTTLLIVGIVVAVFIVGLALAAFVTRRRKAPPPPPPSTEP